MKFERIEESEYEAFASQWPNASFLQSVNMAHRRDRDGWTPHFVGVRADDGTLVGVAHLSVRPVFMGYTDVECQQGPLVDYDDEVAVFFLRKIREYASQIKALTLLINPNIAANHRDAEAHIKADGYDSGRYKQLFADAGYTHLDNIEIDKDPWLMRWYFYKDLSGIKSEDELMDSFAQQTRWSVRKALKSSVRVRQIDEGELEMFYGMLVATSERRSFTTRSIDYFRSLMKIYPPEDVQYLVAELPIDEYIVNLTAQHDEAQLAAESNDPASIDKKQRTAHRVATEAVDHYSRKLAEAEELAKEHKVLLLAVGVFIIYSDSMTYFVSGADTSHRAFCAPYALQWHAMNYARERGLRLYNFYGTRGDFSGNPEQQGVYEFKKGFGGYVEEQIGYFEARPHMLINTVRDLIQKIRG